MVVLPGLVAPELGSEIRKMLDVPHRFLLCMGNDHLGPILPQTLPSVKWAEGASERSKIDGSQAGTMLLDQVHDLLLEAQEGPAPVDHTYGPIPPRFAQNWSPSARSENA
jgi:hypothetical protein